MSAPEMRLLSDAAAAEIEATATLALARREELSGIACEFAAAALALVRDREARCELMVQRRS